MKKSKTEVKIQRRLKDRLERRTPKLGLAKKLWDWWLEVEKVLRRKK